MRFFSISKNSRHGNNIIMIFTYICIWVIIFPFYLYLFAFFLSFLSFVQVIATRTVVFCSRVKSNKMKFTSDYFKCVFNFINVLNPVCFDVVCKARNICKSMYMHERAKKLLILYIRSLSIFLFNANTTG